MTPEQIRELAIERMGAVIAEHDIVLAWGTDFDSCQCGWAGDEDDWGLHVADAAVDALGDLLPTQIEEKRTEVIHWGSDVPLRTYPPDQRYVTDWRPVDA